MARLSDVSRLVGRSLLGGWLLACGAEPTVRTAPPVQAPPGSTTDETMPGEEPVVTTGTVLTAVGARRTALTSDARFIYFVTSKETSGVDRVARVSKQGGAVTELATFEGEPSERRTIVRAGNTLLVASGGAFYSVPTSGGSARALEPAPITSVRPDGDHVLASNGLFAAWMTADGTLFATEGIQPPSPFAIPSDIPKERRTTSSVAVGNDAVFVATTYATADGTWAGRVLRYSMTGALVRDQVLPGRQSPPALSVAGGRLLLAFHDGIEELDDVTLAYAPREPAAATMRDVANLAPFGEEGVLVFEKKSPDEFGGKLDAFHVSAYANRSASASYLGNAGSPRLGASIVVEGRHAYWVRRADTSSDGPGVIERIDLPEE